MDNEIDPIVTEFLARQIAYDYSLIPFSRKRRIARKIYRVIKAAFFGGPFIVWAIKDIFTEIAYAGTEKMTRKLPVVAMMAFIPAGFATTGLAVYKTVTSPTIRSIAATCTNLAGLCYTYPVFMMDHSVLFFVEKAVFGAPVPIFPNGKLLLIHNETELVNSVELAKTLLNKYYQTKEENL